MSEGGERNIVVLKVYNIMGQEIATLVDGVQEAGSTSVDFNASSLPSGIYSYRMNASSGNISYITTRKMLLLK